MRYIKISSAILILTAITITFACKSNQSNAVINKIQKITTLQPVNVIDLSSILIEPSGIVYNENSHSLLIVSDARPYIYVFDFNGKILNQISVSGVDMEGIALSKNSDTIYVVEETAKLVSSFSYNGTKINSMVVDVSTNPGHILEGITVDNNGNIFVINEKFPAMLLEFSGSKELSRQEITFTSDLSDICYDKSLDCFWIVSDESKKIIKIDRDGSLLGEWLIPFEKGEGITLVQDKMYIVCDSDSKMYVFQKP